MSSEAAEPSPPCFVCGKPGPFRCSTCKEYNYCSAECQAGHWKSGHKKFCLPPDAEPRYQTLVSHTKQTLRAARVSQGPSWSESQIKQKFPDVFQSEVMKVAGVNIFCAANLKKCPAPGNGNDNQFFTYLMSELDSGVADWKFQYLDHRGLPDILIYRKDNGGNPIPLTTTEGWFLFGSLLELQGVYGAQLQGGGPKCFKTFFRDFQDGWNKKNKDQQVFIFE